MLAKYYLEMHDNVICNIHGYLNIKYSVFLYVVLIEGEFQSYTSKEISPEFCIRIDQQMTKLQTLYNSKYSTVSTSTEYVYV